MYLGDTTRTEVLFSVEDLIAAQMPTGPSNRLEHFAASLREKVVWGDGILLIDLFAGETLPGQRPWLDWLTAFRHRLSHLAMNQSRSLSGKESRACVSNDSDGSRKNEATIALQREIPFHVLGANRIFSPPS